MTSFQPRLRVLGAIASAALALCTSAGLASADPTDSLEDDEELSWGWRAFGGVHGFSDKSLLGDGEQSSITNTVIVGLRMYQKLGSWVSLEGELPIGITTSRDDRATLFVSMPRAHGRLSPFGDVVFSPSLVVGVGTPVVTSTRQSSVPTDIQPAVYGGLGFDLKLEGLRIGLEGRYIAMRAEEGNAPASDWEVLVTFGLRSKSKANKLPPPPPPDADRDGIPDADDACPDRAEDMDGFEDTDGCPELDNDKDGVIDGLDRCQGEAETFNGYQDDDGCPDEVSADVRLVEGTIAGIRFDAGSGVMDDLGLEELDKLAELLKANPSIKIKLYGHGDDRADSVREYLIEQGVGFGRIKAFSRSDSEPFADNETASGRRANRRVEVQLDREDD